jgi:hypothetical protein
MSRGVMALEWVWVFTGNVAKLKKKQNKLFGTT